ncbi:hypothetical protein [Mucilaginibacter sp. CSA2-8R]|uniref:hypothetical protein n=1 Tax=Mucilaginibacter sp. CSA2-8R TaxID=3141542 RepID=UPI00315C83A6
MKYLLVLLLSVCACTAMAQNPAACFYGTNTLQGKLIYKDLIHPVRLDTIKHALVFELPASILFKANSAGTGYEDSTTARYIRVYSDANGTTPAELRYKPLIGKPIAITANYRCSPSMDYTLPVNINEDFKYKLIKQDKSRP